MSAISMILASAAAVIGAVLWGLVTWQTGYEIGIAAWGLGLFVAGGCVLGGGRGSQAGIVCAVLTLAAIAGGKVAAVGFAVDEGIESSLTEELYEEMRADAEVFAALPENADYRKFMIERGYTQETSVDAITPKDLRYFRENNVPHLEALADEQLSLEEWQDREEDVFWESTSTIDVLKSEASFYDLLWAILGVCTAYGVVKGREEE